MCYPIGARLAQRRILALDTLYHHLFSTPGRDATTTNQLKHDLVLWLTHPSFEELPDALEYYLADPNSDLEGDLAHLTCLDPWGVQVHIHPLVTIYINTLLAWAKCFLATYGVYPGLYDLLDTPKLDFLAAQLHLRDTTLPRPLLHHARGPPTIRSEYVAFQPHLAPPPPPDRLSVCRTNRLSFNTSVCHATRPSVILTAPTVCLSPRKSVALSVHPTDSPSVIPALCHTNRPSTLPSSVRHPTRQSCATSVRPSVTVRPSVHHPTTSVRLSYVTPSARHTNPSVRPSATITPSVRHPNQSIRPSANAPTSVRLPHPSVRPSATVTPSVRHTNQSVSLSVTSRLSDRHYDSSARTSVISHDSPYPRLEPLPSSREWGAGLEPLPSSREWGARVEPLPSSREAVTHDSLYTRLEPIPSSRAWGAIPQGKIFPRAFTNYDLLLRALDASSIYLRDL